MNQADPHIHVNHKVVEASVNMRDTLAATFGLAADAPSLVTTGCGQQVPFAMTSPRPEQVTCLACREHARREHLNFADQIEQLSRMAGSAVSPEDGTKVAHRHRDLAEEFGG
jgi:hypothetical protein